MPLTEYDMQHCPQCDGTRLLKYWDATVLEYGREPETVKLIFAMPLTRCLDEACGQMWSSHDGEKAQEEAIMMYRRALCPTPNIQRWIDNVKDRALAGVPPSLIEAVVKSWELYRLSMEAGAGIEPASSGV